MAFSRIHRLQCHRIAREIKLIRLSMPSETKTKEVVVVARYLWSHKVRLRVQMKGYCSRGAQEAVEVVLEQCLTPRLTQAGIAGRRNTKMTHLTHLSNRASQISCHRHCSSNSLMYPWSALSTKISSISSSYRCSNSNSSSSNSKLWFSSRCTIESSKGCRNINNSSTFSSSSNSN